MTLGGPSAAIFFCRGMDPFAPVLAKFGDEEWHLHWLAWKRRQVM
jgi:hypothetical protein